MEWNSNWSESSSRQVRTLHGRRASRGQAQVCQAAQVFDQSSQNSVQTYRTHMLLSALMLAIALLLANLQ